MKNLFFFFFILSLSSCGVNLLAPEKQEKDLPSLEEIFKSRLDTGNEIISRLLKAVKESENQEEAQEILDQMMPGVLETLTEEILKQETPNIDLPEITSPEKVIEVLDGAGKITPEIAAAAAIAYADQKKKFENAEGEEKNQIQENLKKAAAISAGSIIKENFYTEEDEFDLEKGEDTLTEEEAEKIVEQVAVLDEINGEDKFKDLTEESTGKTNKQKVLDYLKAGSLALKNRRS